MMKFYKKILLSVILNSILFWGLNRYFNEISAPFFTGNFEIIGNWKSFIFLAVLFGFLNWFVRPILDIITIPIRFITIGLFGFILNAIMLFLLELGVKFLQLFNTDLIISGWITYLVIGLILSVTNGVIHWFED